jgi:ATP-dependent protease ClpP protease subunit
MNGVWSVVSGSLDHADTIHNTTHQDHSPQTRMRNDPDNDHGPVEIALVGDLTTAAAELSDKLLEVPPGEACILYFDSPGGSPYTAISLMNLLLMRGIQATGIVTGECSSATIWPLAACKRRIVTPLSVLLFHPMKWQSEENVGIEEAVEWARHFGQLEEEMDRLLAQLLGISPERLAPWMKPGRYVTGKEFAAAGLAELVDLSDYSRLRSELHDTRHATAGGSKGSKAGKKPQPKRS